MKKYIKLLLVILLLFTITITVNAEVKTEDRNTLNNLGVNKKWEITAKNKSNVLNTPKVDSSEKIYDFENVLTEEEKTNLKTQIDQYMEKTGYELIILIKNMEYYYDEANEEYAADFYDYNDFALELKGYSGTLLFRNTYEEDPYFDMYMFGETQLYYQGDGRNDAILDTIYNDLHEGNYYDGFSLYISMLDNYYDKGIANDLKNYYVDEDGYLQKHFTIHYLFMALFSIILSLITMLTMKSKNKMIHKATEATDYLDKASTIFNEKTDNLISTHTTHHIITSSSGGGGGFHSSGGSSGGGHSSGGGRHG